MGFRFWAELIGDRVGNRTGRSNELQANEKPKFWDPELSGQNAASAGVGIEVEADFDGDVAVKWLRLNSAMLNRSSTHTHTAVYMYTWRKWA